MPKKKISSQDFLNLMDEQDSSSEKVPFAQKSKPKPQRLKSKKKPIQILGRYTLTPMQEEWVQFAIARTPKFVWNLVASPTAQKLVDKVQARLFRDRGSR